MNAARLQKFLSDTARAATRNEIRELLKLVSRPGIISFAGGLPSPEVFPIREIVELLPAALEDSGATALQYGATEGDMGLRRQLIRLLRELDGQTYDRLTPEHVQITSASQQGLDLCGRAFITPGDAVICGLPTYLGALGAFTGCRARLIGIPLDEEGIRGDLLEERLVELRREGTLPKLIYTVPDFQNPTGVTLSRSRREELLSIAREFDLLVIEDSPYRHLRYVGSPQPTLAELDRDERVISLFTFSKLLFPGMRLGWIVAAPEIIARLAIAKQSVDLCTSGLSQLIALKYLETGHLTGQLQRARQIYARKRLAMLEALEREMDPAWNARWTRPEGGLFLWLTLAPGTDGQALCERALRDKVAFVVGRAFHCDGSGRNTLRLNFSYPSIPEIQSGVRRLARCIGEFMRDAPRSPGTKRASGMVAADENPGPFSAELVLSEVVE